MFGIFRKKSKNSDVLRNFDGREVKYVTKRVTDSDGNVNYDIVGKRGRIAVIGDRIRVICGETDVFDCPKDAAKYYLLLSGDGVTVEGDNTVSGCYDTITAYYTYYRK